MLVKWRAQLKTWLKQLRAIKMANTFSPVYRLVEINKTAEDEYIVTIQIINKGISLNFKPEELLAHDEMVNGFSPTDVRTLTYLGYLGINSPKYKILAQRLSENQDRMTFALKKKGDKNIHFKTAAEISTEQNIIKNLSSSDANIIGYITASESINNEKLNFN